MIASIDTTPCASGSEVNADVSLSAIMEVGPLAGTRPFEVDHQPPHHAPVIQLERADNRRTHL